MSLRNSQNKSRKLCTAFILSLPFASLIACGATTVAPPPVQQGNRAPSSASVPGVLTPPALSAPTPVTSASAPPTHSAAPVDTTKFPPDPFKPPFDRVAQVGDGTWSALENGLGADGSPSMFHTTVHPHSVKRFTSVEVVAMDLRRVQIVAVAGMVEPESKTVGTQARTGLVPAADIPNLLAVFNGGFMEQHGHYGMRVNEHLFVPARADACTVGILADGAVEIATFSALQPRETQMVAWRQTPSCLIEKGELNPALNSEATSRRWGHSIEKKTEIRRSSIGIDATGRVLLFGIGEEVAPKDIAVAMKAAGAVDAAQLDINWSYTRFLVFGKVGTGGYPEVSFTLLPKMKFGHREYVQQAAARDFFYVRRKTN